MLPLNGLLVVSLLSGCSKEQPVSSVDELMRNDVLLEATLVRCTQNRAEMRYQPECVNAREAAMLIEVREEKARREQLEAQSQRKRDALRRRQEAVAAARRRAEQRDDILETGGVVVQFEELPRSEAYPAAVGSGDVMQSGAIDFSPAGSAEPNAPTAIIESEPGVVANDVVATDVAGTAPVDENAEFADGAVVNEPAPAVESVSDLEA
ncbi:MAG: EexN family lipoprotein, partial [Pseudomonadota bacterium]